MNLEQLSQIVTWLDEEHRKEKTQLTELGNQLTQQYTQLAGLNKSFQDLEERLARVQSQALRYAQIEQTLGQSKAEVQIMLDQFQKQRMQADEEAFKIRQMERERQEQILSALQLQIEALQQFQRAIVGDHDVLTRLDLSLATLQRELEEGIRRDQAIDQRIQVVEEWASRFGQVTTEMHQLSERLRQERADAAEAARRAEQQRARHMAEWAEQMKTSRRELDDWFTQLRTMQEQHKESRTVYTSLLELEERMKQMEARLLQWQRLVEESRRKERDQLLGDVEKRWQQQLGEWQFLRDEWNKRLTAITERITKLEDWRPEIVSQLPDLLERIERERRERLAMFADILKAENDLGRQQLLNLEKTLGELLARVEGEKVVKPKARAKGG